MEAYMAKTIGEVLEVLGEYKERGKIIAGGTDIIISMREGRVSPDALIDVSRIEELQRIEDKGKYIEMGAGVTFTQVVDSPLFEGNLNGLARACRSVGSPQIRNRGTIGGNIANGSPAADSIPPLLCLDTTIILESVRGKREIGLGEYYDEGKGIEDDELLTFIRLKKTSINEKLSFAKLGLRKALAISRISIGSLLGLDEDNRVKTIKIASGSLGKYPMRESGLEEFLMGETLTRDKIEEGIGVLRQAMDERLGGRPTLAYKRLAVEKVLRSALEDGIKRSKGVGTW